MRVLVANRGEIAVRVMRTLRELGLESVAVFTDPDRDAPHAQLADQAIGLGEPRAYLDIPKVIAAAQRSGATAVHPGYGFLAEKAEFSRACSDAGLTFIGPSPEAIAAFGDKRSARALAEASGVPVVPGAKACESPEEAERVAAQIGYPILLKAAGGGGGKGMRRVESAAGMAAAFASAAREAQNAFADARLFLEKLIHPARHVEVQILGDGKRAVAVGDRECSLQRRYQKVVEEAPCAAIAPETREALFEAATKLVGAAGYAGAGTVEFLVGPDERFYFLEVNTRLQVEHPVTELVTGLDLVAEQIRIAQGGALPEPPARRGHAIEVRLNAEDAYGGFLPQTGEVVALEWPQWPGLRIDSGIALGSVVSPFYDSMLAKVIAFAATREEARRRLLAGLRATTVLGVVTNLAFLIDILERDFYREGATFTSTIETQTWTAPEIPGAARAAAERLLRKPAGSEASGASDRDRHSPFHTLGAFRIGA